MVVDWGLNSETWQPLESYRNISGTSLETDGRGQFVFSLTNKSEQAVAASCWLIYLKKNNADVSTQINFVRILSEFFHLQLLYMKITIMEILCRMEAVLD